MFFILKENFKLFSQGHWYKQQLNDLVNNFNYLVKQMHIHK